MARLAGCISAILVVIACENFAFAAAQQKSRSGTDFTYSYDTPKVKLDGVLIERKVYGPPGYGETPSKDTRTTILVLRLSHAIDVEPLPNATATETPDLDAVKSAREVQLFISPSKRIDSEQFVGRTVTVVGTLHESITAMQYTKVWVEAEKLFPAK